LITRGRRRSLLLVYTATFGVLSILLSTFKVQFPLGNPNLGSSPVSMAALVVPAPAAMVVGIIKGLGVSLWTGQALLELPAGLGDGMMAIFTNRLAKRINRLAAIVIGQISRYFFTSGMIAIVLGAAVSLNFSLPGAQFLFSKLVSLAPWFDPAGLPPVLANMAMVWVAMLPAITASIVANAILSVGVTAALMKFFPSLFNNI
jgi:hypothetical protein